MKLKEVMSDYLTEGAIFTKLADYYTLPFADDIEDMKVLDIDFMSKYGNRETSVLIDNLLDSDINAVIESLKNKHLANVQDNDDRLVLNEAYNNLVQYSKNGVKPIASVVGILLWQKYQRQWTKLWETMKLDYNPIHNYNMTETETTSGTGESSGTNKTTSDNTTTSTTTAGISTTQTTNDSTYGFNSTSASPTDNSTTTTTPSGTEKVETNVKGDGSKNYIESDSESKYDDTRNLTRQGNIGVTTSQKMVNDERQVWLYDYFDTIFKQVAREVTAPIYRF